MAGFEGTFTATPVTDLHRGDQVQWYGDQATVRTVTTDDGEHVLLGLSVSNRIRPIEKRLPKSYVLMVQRPADLPSA